MLIQFSSLVCYVLLLKMSNKFEFEFEFLCLTPISAIFQLYHGDKFYWWRKPEYPERTTDHWQVTGKHYHLWLWVECTLYCHLQSRARTRRIGDRLVWVVRFNYLTLCATLKMSNKLKNKNNVVNIFTYIHYIQMYVLILLGSK